MGIESKIVEPMVLNVVRPTWWSTRQRDLQDERKRFIAKSMRRFRSAFLLFIALSKRKVM